MIRTLPSMEPQTQSLGAPGLLVRFNTTLTLLSAHFDECLNALDRPGGGTKKPYLGSRVQGSGFGVRVRGQVR